jgi:hypothetical protein
MADCLSRLRSQRLGVQYLHKHLLLLFGVVLPLVLAPASPDLSGLLAGRRIAGHHTLSSRRGRGQRAMTPSALLTRRTAWFRHVYGMLLITRSPPLCSGSRTMACSLSSISSLTPADQPCLLPILSISSLPLAMADRRALIFVPVRSSLPSLADLIRPFPLASTRYTRGRNSGDLSCSSIRAFSSALRSGLLPASSLASRPHGDWEWYNSLASLGGTLPPLPIGRVGTTGAASLALTARGCELPLCGPRP